jgi:hypothetical protein
MAIDFLSPLLTIPPAWYTTPSPFFAGAGRGSEVEVVPGASDPKIPGAYLALAQVGLEMVVPILLGLGLDYGLGWAPWGVIAGALLGLFGGMFHLITIQKRPVKSPPSDSGGGT